MTQTATVQMDKEELRSQISDSSELTLENRGFLRVMGLVEDAIREHDEECSKDDPSIWQAEYSLLEHSKNVQEKLVSLCRLMGMSETAICIASMAGLTHDLGKLHKDCKPYRFNRWGLSPEERKDVDRHPDFSADYILSFMDQVRFTEIALLADVWEVDKYHHHPSMITVAALVDIATLRQIGINLNAVDRYVSLREKRGDRPPHSHPAALSIMDGDMRVLAHKSANHPFRYQVFRTIEGLNTLGPE